MRRITHREGDRILLFSILITLAGSVVALWSLPLGWGLAIVAILALKTSFICHFFRVPHREALAVDSQTLLSPADGTVVAIEEVYEDEVLNEKRIQVSIFMSIWNIHINWFPIGGAVEYFRHHQGKFLVAWHPKSSTDNERTTTVVRSSTGQRILFRQIAGFVARRIVNYATLGSQVEQASECGFIKFGSRVNLFLPLGSEIHVSLDQKVTGTQTPIATLPNTVAP